MAFLGEKRFTEFRVVGAWTKTVGPDGKRSYTATQAGGTATVVKSDGSTQVHTECPVGSKLISDGACVEVDIP